MLIDSRHLDIYLPASALSFGFHPYSRIGRCGILVLIFDLYLIRYLHYLVVALVAAAVAAAAAVVVAAAVAAPVAVETRRGDNSPTTFPGVHHDKAKGRCHHLLAPQIQQALRRCVEAA